MLSGIEIFMFSVSDHLNEKNKVVQAKSGNGPKLETRPQFPLLYLTQNWKRSCLTQKWKPVSQLGNS